MSSPSKPAPGGWVPGEPAWCGEHGPLPGRPLSLRDAEILLLEHRLAVHGDDVAEDLARLRSRGRALTSAGAR